MPKNIEIKYIVDDTDLIKVKRQLGLVEDGQEDLEKAVESVNKEVERQGRTFKESGEKADKSIKKTKKRVDVLSKSISDLKRVLIGAFAVEGIRRIGSELLNTATVVELTGNKASTVFGQYKKDVEAVGEATATAMGLTQNEFLAATTNIGDLLVPMGFAREEAAKMSTDLIGLSGALSQWTGGQVSAIEVSDILSKAILGEREQLKTLGVSINEADINAKLLDKSQNKLTGTALQQAKAQATLELIFQRTTDAQAAYADGAENLVGTKAGLRAEAVELKESLSRGLIPVFKSLLGAGRDFLKFLRENRDVIVAILKVLGTAVTAFVSYKAAVIATNVATKALTAIQTAYSTVTGLLTGKIKLATIAQKAFNVAAKANPIGLIISVVTAAATAFALFRDRVSETAKQQKRLNDLSVKAEESIAAEVLEVERLVKVAQDKNRSDKEREAAIKRLNEISPEYLGNITLETINTDEARIATEKYIKTLDLRAKAQAATELQIEAHKKLLKVQNDLSESSATFFQQLGNEILSLGNGVIAAELNTKSALKNQSESVKDLKNAITLYGDEINKANSELIKLNVSTKESGDETDTDTNKKRKAVGVIEKLREEAQKLRQERDRARSEEEIRAYNERISFIDKEISRLNDLGSAQIESKEKRDKAVRDSIEQFREADKQLKELLDEFDKQSEERHAREIQRGVEKINANNQRAENERETGEVISQIGTDVSKSIVSGFQAVGVEGERLAVFQQAAALFQIGADTAQAISGLTKVSIGTKGIFGFAELAAGIAVIISNIARARSVLSGNQVPQYFEGTDFVGLNGFPRGKDTVPAMLTAGEAVINDKTNKAYHPTVKAIRRHSIPPEAINSYVENFTRAPKFSIPKSNETQLNQYERFDDSGIINKLDNLPIHQTYFDERGVSQFFVKGQNRTQILNKRYRF